MSIYIEHVSMTCVHAQMVHAISDPQWLTLHPQPAGFCLLCMHRGGCMHLINCYLAKLLTLTFAVINNRRPRTPA